MNARFHLMTQERLLRCYILSHAHAIVAWKRLQVVALELYPVVNETASVTSSVTFHAHLKVMFEVGHPTCSQVA